MKYFGYLIGIVLCVSLSYGCQKAANAAPGAVTGSVYFPQYSTSNMSKPLRPCSVGTSALRQGTAGNSVWLYVCTSTASTKKTWRKVAFTTVSGSKANN